MEIKIVNINLIKQGTLSVNLLPAKLGFIGEVLRKNLKKILANV